ncbi:MAG TPA: alpha/beta hydrolase [Pyrinomonadaceae bacterium]
MSDARVRPSERVQGLTARATGRLPVWLQLRLSGRPQIVIDEQTLDPQVQLLLAIHRKRRPYGLCHPSPAEARARFRRDTLATAVTKTSVGAVRELEIPGVDGCLRARHYAPPAADRCPDLLVYLHGGGFVLGDLDTHDEPCRLLCRHADTHVLSIDYRLAPEHPFPAALNDALAALRWAQGNAATLGAQRSRVALGGDSAGGNLTAVAAQFAARGGYPPVAQLLIYPAIDAMTATASKEMFGDGFFLDRQDCDDFLHYYTDGTGVSDDDPRVSPLRATDFSGLPPALVVTAGFDVLRDEGEAYAAALREAGTIVLPRRFPALGHGFIHMTGISHAAHHATIEVARDWRALLDSTSS